MFSARLPVIAGLLSSLVFAAAAPAAELPRGKNYADVVAQTAAMVGDADAQRLANQRGLQILNLTWEDTGRFKNSAVGPNISDMTIQVQTKNQRSGAYNLTCMPVIRFPNFEDRSGDIPPEKFFLMVGNESGKELRPVSLREYLANIRKYLSKPDSWKGDQTYMLANRDSHVLVSAQACFLPVPKEGSAEFNPVLFNYQSTADSPGVLAILATREGTSATIIDNQRDGFAAGRAHGQRLFFNHKGERASFTGQRLSDFKSTQPSGTVTAAGEKGLNMVLLIQVPLKQKRPERQLVDADVACCPACAPVPAMEKAAQAENRSDVELAVIGHGKVEGPFTEFTNVPVERDPNFPVRVTVQFYKATSNGVVSDADVAEVSEQINKIYAQADFVGSLVTDGLTERPTEHDGPKVQTPEWWEEFWARHAQRTGFNRAEVVAEMRRTRGEEWFPRTEQELADEAEQHEYPNRMFFGLTTTLSKFWRTTSPGSRLLVAMLVVVLGIVAYDLGRRGMRNFGLAS